MDTRAADCGRTFDHAPHNYRTPRGKVKACDGAVGKRALPAALVKGGGR